ncbi:hypothetical protein DEU56DRAFT_913040 [Suillus clintonianus]|uniref:uncharacterized protein n=1 Tax=Suillus clintonianus TaxID=1904413 RepID=UPI001B862D9D|nr:uncharacterized protein DEU56DRAFT_913040 [Suillus clintonianus]KAG2136466.1 hypothetical protein DEU56DRAFT_913040 [Suillus clintonianus]
MPVNAPNHENIQGCSLATFNNQCVPLLFANEPHEPVDHAIYYRALNLALTGKDPATGIQYSIEPTRNRITRDREVTVVRDYDSLISFTHWIPIVRDIYIYPLSNPVDTLTSHVHVKVPMKIHALRPEVPVYPHQIPNICLGVANVRTRLRIFFPALYEQGKTSVELTLEQKTAIYEDGLLPTLKHLNPETVTNWPTSYATALIRAQKRNNQYQYGTRPFPSAMVPNLGYELPRFLSEKHPWARDMLFMTQVQGVKEANQHIPESQYDALEALFEMMDDLDPGLREETNCWIDVGLEISEPGFSYQWRTDSHTHIINHFTCLNDNRAANYVNGPSRDYNRDICAGLLHVSGFRGTFALGDDNPVYLQAYTTDKALIQQLDGGRHGLAISGKQLLEGCPPPYMQKIFDVYYDAKENHSCAARLELRLPVKYAASRGLRFTEELIRNSILAFESKDWWQWRIIRVTAFSRTLALQNQTGGALRIGPDALALTAGIHWMTNGLHSRPDDGSAARDVMCTVLPLTRDYQNDMLQIRPRDANIQHGDMLPFSAFGAYFFRDIVWPPTTDVPRLQRGPMMRQSTFKFVFGMDYDALKRKYHPPAFIPRTMVPRTRVRTQKGFSKRHRVDDPAPAPIFVGLDIDLGGAQQDAGEDLPWEERADLPPDIEEECSVQLTKLWNQFCSDLLQKCGNLKNQQFAASHCRLSMEERLHVTDEVYKDLNLAMVFNRVQWKKVTGQEWADAFDIFFPPRNAPLRLQPQNFPTMKYWEEWFQMKQRLPPQSADTIRTRYWRLFKQLLWVPKPHKDRLWKYTANNDFRILPANYGGQAPQVIVSPSSNAPRWEPERVPGGDAEGEEEEAAEEEEMDEPEVNRREWVNGIAPIPDRILLREEEEESGSEEDM